MSKIMQLHQSLTRHLLLMFISTVLGLGVSAAGLSKAQAEEPQGSLERITVAYDGGATNGPSGLAVISADGRYVAFASEATNLVHDGRGAGYFIHDRHTGQTERIAPDLTLDGNSEHSFPISIADDGHSVGFLTEGRQNYYRLEFSIYDRQIEQLHQAFDFRASLSDFLLATSAGNRFLVVSSLDNTWDGTVLVFDTQTRETDRVPVLSTITDNELSGAALGISADGNYIACLVVSDLGNYQYDWNIFIHDRQTGLNKSVAVGNKKLRPDGDTMGFNSPISADGRHFALWLHSAEWQVNNERILLSYDYQTEQAEYTTFPLHFPLDTHSLEQSDVVVSSDISHVSVDGRYVFFHIRTHSDNRNLRIYDRFSGTFEQLPSAPFRSAYTIPLSNAIISGDGRYIVYQYWDEEQDARAERVELYVYDRWPHLPHTYDPDYVPPLTAGNAPPLDSDTGLPAGDSASPALPDTEQTAVSQPLTIENFTLSEAVIYWRETPWLFWGSLSVGGLSILLLALLGIVAWRSLSSSNTSPRPAPVTNRPLCPKCGQPLPGVGTFCGQCGHRLTNAEPAKPPPKTPSTPAPVDTAAYTTRGISQVRVGDLSAAVATLRQVIDQEPTNSEAWLWLGFAYGRQGNRPLAERCFHKAQQLGNRQAVQALDWLKR
jgi:hypothetical protein